MERFKDLKNIENLGISQFKKARGKQLELYQNTPILLKSPSNPLDNPNDYNNSEGYKLNR